MVLVLKFTNKMLSLFLLGIIFYSNPALAMVTDLPEATLQPSAKTELPSKISALASSIFSYEDGSNQLRVHLQGVTSKGHSWSARDVRREDIPFLQELFADKNVMINFGNGLPRSHQSTAQRVANIWIPRFMQGHPHGALIIFDDKGKPIGHVIAGGGDRPGTSEIAYAFITEVWRKGIGNSVVNEIVNTWAPQVRQLAFDTDDKAKLFRCFGGEPLNQLDATASPSNVASWKILLIQGFTAAQYGLDKSAPVIDLSSDDNFLGDPYNEIEDCRLMEQYVLKFFLEQRHLLPSKRYTFIDHKNRTFTISFDPRFKRLEYHFEKVVR